MSKKLIGTVGSIRRYAVKSMLGEELKQANLTEQGLQGDRAFALIDAESGKVASAKSPRKWGGLLDCHAKLIENTETETEDVEIILPDNSRICSNKPDSDEQLSAWAGRKLTLTKAQTSTENRLFEVVTPDIAGLVNQNTVIDAPVSAGSAPGTFFNFAPLHLLTTASLQKLQELAPNSNWSVERFRPNLLIETNPNTSGFIENDWIGQTLFIGAKVQLRITVGCPRCIVTTLPQENGKLTKDEGILRAIVQHNRIDLGEYGKQACVGVYTQILQGGTIESGDEVYI